MSKAQIVVKLLSACNYDHDRIGTVIVGEEALDFRLERNGKLLVSNDSERFVDIKKMGLPVMNWGSMQNIQPRERS